MAIFGENFTIEFPASPGSTGEVAPEDSVHLGDRFSVGSAEVIVTQPRLPCYKLGIRFQADDMVRRFLASGRTGFYLAVIREGEVGAGDAMKVIARDPNRVPVSEITRLYIAKRYNNDDVASLRRALRVDALPESWKEYFESGCSGWESRRNEGNLAWTRGARRSSFMLHILLSTRLVGNG